MNDCSFLQLLRQNLTCFFVLTQKNAFSSRFHSKANRRSIGSCKNGTRDFQNSPPFERLACFYLSLILKKIFWKTKPFSKNKRILFFSWKYWDWKHFICKTALGPVTKLVNTTAEKSFFLKLNFYCFNLIPKSINCQKNNISLSISFVVTCLSKKLMKVICQTYRTFLKLCWSDCAELKSTWMK